MTDPVDVYDPIGNASDGEEFAKKTKPPFPGGNGGRVYSNPNAGAKQSAQNASHQQSTGSTGQSAGQASTGGGSMPPFGMPQRQRYSPHQPGSPEYIISERMEDALRDFLNAGYSVQETLEHFYDFFTSYIQHHDAIFGSSGDPNQPTQADPTVPSPGSPAGP